jgi:hypothetical protein
LSSLRKLAVSENEITKIQDFDEETWLYLWLCDLRSNKIEIPSVLSSLAKLPTLFHIRISGNPLVKEDNSHVPQVIVILPYISDLDDKYVNSKDKVKASSKVKESSS